MRYNPRKIEKKWQSYWAKKGLYRSADFSKKPKKYVLDMFPYPSGEGLHVGHVEGYTATDIISRHVRMQGFNVLHPMGWDAFGLPAENYAISQKIHPRIAVEKNIKKFKKQLEMFGFDYDWSREINTTDPSYYKWTQRIFLKMFEKGLAYEAEVPINWCPKCKTGLANEEVSEGKCERCAEPVERKKMRQWMLKITAYADRLLKDLDKLDWSEKIKTMQRNWIGRSVGSEIKFQILLPKTQSNTKQNTKQHEYIKVFTTRPDTLFGATYMVLAPEHELVDKITTDSQMEEIGKYVEEAKRKSDLERAELTKEKTGVFTGAYAINPVNGKEIPIWVSDYVLISYGTGAIMAVPAHDERDFEFAKKFDLQIIEVISPDGKKHELKEAYVGEGVLINSEKFNGVKSELAKNKVTKWLAEKGLAKRDVNYKLRDWIFSRQRYWGEPFPLVFCPACKKQAENSKAPPSSRLRRTSEIRNPKFNKGELLNPGWTAVLEKDLPLELPRVRSYEPAGTGESPLVNIKKWADTKCPRCGCGAKRETNTMPQWAGSCWYYLRYIDPHNNKALIDKEKERYWMPVDLYLGGAEHAVLHLLYARFWHKFLYDIGAVSIDEPFMKLVNQGLILGPDSQKMSKSRGNVVNPDDVIKAYGADTIRMYEMFMGPLADVKPWDTKGIIGIYRFLGRVWGLAQELKVKSQKLKVGRGSKAEGGELERLRHKTIKKVTEDIEGFRFNTAISAMMEYTNTISNSQFSISKRYVETLLLLLAPFAPHITEELWQNVLGHKNSIHLEKWPEYDPKLIEEQTFELVIQINGKIRDKIKAETGIKEDAAREIVLRQEKIQNYIKDKKIKKIIFVPNKLVNIVV